MSALSIGLEFPVYNSTSSVAVVYPNTATTTMVYISQLEKGDGYYGASDGFHTVMYTATNDFIGTIKMQATLAIAPQEADWFDIMDTTTTYTSLDNRNAATVDIHNFSGNFVWVRGRIAIDNGTVQSILYNH
jgi:hypothetical protein